MTTDTLQYEVTRSNRKTGDIIVERNGSVIVRVPHHIDDAQVSELIESKRLWIYKALAEWRELNASRIDREYKNGEGFLYLGRSYRLQLVHAQDEAVLLKGGRFCVRRDLVQGEDPRPVREAFEKYYTERAIQKLVPRVSYYAPKVGVRATGVEIRDLGFQWGTCATEGRLAFHWKCMMAPQTIIDYIVVHELCHLHHRHHTEAFWNEVDKVMPQWRERKEWLRVNGAGLDV